MVIYTCSPYRECIKKFSKKSKLGYSKCAKDILDSFINDGFVALWEGKDRLQDTGNIRVIKQRSKNSSSGQGKSSGYRTIALVEPDERVFLMYSYPKSGKYGRDNIGDKFLASLIENCAKEIASGE